MNWPYWVLVLLLIRMLIWILLPGFVKDRKDKR